MIRSFRDPEAAALFHTGQSRRFRAFESVALRKLIHLNQARSLRDLALPGNQLEAMTKGRKRRGQHAIRINQQFRVCFTWKDGEVYDVEIVDYH